MKKRFLAIAIAAGLASPFAASAEADLYGRVHLSLDNVEIGAADAEFDMNDRKSAFGVKGKEDLGGGLSAIYKLEWSWDPTDGDDIGTRDRWVGLKSGMGSVKFGTMSNNYKSTAGMVDPFWHSAAEGRGLIGTSSTLLNGTGDDAGRMTNLIQFKTAKMGGIQATIDLQANGSGEMTTGLGVVYKQKAFSVFANMLNYENDADVPADNITDDRSFVAGETATKIGGTFTTAGLTLGLVLEQTEDVVGQDFMMLSAKYKMTDNDTIAFTYGTAEGVIEAFDSDGMALGYMHDMSKRTMVYAAYIDRGWDNEAAAAAANVGVKASGLGGIPGADGGDVSGFSLGIRHSF